jgi:hypothetical protein
MSPMSGHLAQQSGCSIVICIGMIAFFGMGISIFNYSAIRLYMYMSDIYTAPAIMISYGMFREKTKP